MEDSDLQKEAKAECLPGRNPGFSYSCGSQAWTTFKSLRESKTIKPTMQGLRRKIGGQL